MILACILFLSHLCPKVSCSDDALHEKKKKKELVLHTHTHDSSGFKEEMLWSKQVQSLYIYIYSRWSRIITTNHVKTKLNQDKSSVNIRRNNEMIKMRNNK